MKPSRIVAIGGFSLLTAVALWGWSSPQKSGAPVFSITVMGFPLQESDPFGEGATLITTATFDGERIEP